MSAKYITAAMLGSALMATTAFAQTPSTTTSTTTSSSTTSTASSDSSSYQGNWRASKVVGLSVYNDGNESLGSINDLLTDKSGKIVAVIVGVGGFLGVGERYVAIPFEKVKFVTEARQNSAGAANNSGGMAGTRPATTTGSATGSAAGTQTAPSTPAVAAQNPWYPDHAVISTSKDELKSMAEFKYAS